MSGWPVTKAPEPRYCSFCGRSEHEVEVLIAGPCSVFICDEDVAHCAEIIVAKKRQRLAARPAPTSTRSEKGEGDA